MVQIPIYDVGYIGTTVDKAFPGNIVNRFLGVVVQSTHSLLLTDRYDEMAVVVHTYVEENSTELQTCLFSIELKGH